jgi:hypothetical protein
LGVATLDPLAEIQSVFCRPADLGPTLRVLIDIALTVEILSCPIWGHYLKEKNMSLTHDDHVLYAARELNSAEMTAVSGGFSTTPARSALDRTSEPLGPGSSTVILPIAIVSLPLGTEA